LRGGGGALLAHGAGLHFDGAEQFVVGGVGEGIGQLLQQGGGPGLEQGQQLLTPLRTRVVDMNSFGGSFWQQGCRPAVGENSASIFQSNC
jgi:hypothetical protein